MNIAIGADHRGFEHKEYIKKHVKVSGKSIEWLDVGAFNTEYSNYPDFSFTVAQAMVKGEADWGVLLCGSGVGMAIAANRFHGIYAALAWNEEVARLSKEHDKANILVVPSDFVSMEQAASMVQVWLAADFLGGRYQQRIDIIDSWNRNSI